jgi:hypothetical protein
MEEWKYGSALALSFALYALSLNNNFAVQNI